MYEGLETNIPHVLMRHSDAYSLENHQLFPTRETVLEYLEEYAKEISHLVQFETQVTNISFSSIAGKDTWTIHTLHLPSVKSSQAEYDAVIVANGHYNVPTLPPINGIADWNRAFPGVIAHSKFYQDAEAYRGKKVLIVGNAASGTDICSQISAVAKLPVYVSQRSENYLANSADFKKTVSEIHEFLSPASAPRAVRLKDGSILTDIDAVLFCTGYFYSFPFLWNLEPNLIGNGERVQNLYRHIFYIPHPTLAFVGLPSKIIPFRTFEGQAAVIARTYSGRLELPPEAEMKDWEHREMENRGSGKAYEVLPYPADFEYHNSMVDWASESMSPGEGKLPPKWSQKETWQRARFPEIKKAFAARKEARPNVRTIEELGFVYEEAIADQ